MKTSTWTRSPRGKIFGVATGFAEWIDLEPRIVQALCAVIICLSGGFPGLLIYLVLALFLKEQKESDILDENSYTQRTKRAKNATFSDIDETEELRKKYESLKRKVEQMENEVFNKEKNWDDKFHSSN